MCGQDFVFEGVTGKNYRAAKERCNAFDGVAVSQQLASVLGLPIAVEVGDDRKFAGIFVLKIIEVARVKCTWRISGVHEFRGLDASEAGAVEVGDKVMDDGEVGQLGAVHWIAGPPSNLIRSNFRVDGCLASGANGCGAQCVFFAQMVEV